VLTRGRTTIAIAHRLSTLRNAGRIVVLEHGKRIEEGAHEELMALDGTYARLVRIQTQRTKESTVDGLADADGKPGSAHPSPWEQQCNGMESADFAPRWLRPTTARFQRGEHGTLQLESGDEVHGGLFAVRCLPATEPQRFISLRHADADGQEHEVGMVRDLADWPPAVRALLEQSLLRRYFIRRVTAIESIECRYGLLTFQVRTDGGAAQFVMRNSHSQAQDYGASGKLLIDVDDNRFLVEDIDALPRRQQMLFRRFVYW
jgi:hypothetical protein